MRLIILILLSVACCYTCTYSQQTIQKIEKLGNGKFNYNGQKYKFNQMEFIFSDNPTLSKNFHKSISASRKAKIWGWSTIGVITLSTVAIFAFEGYDGITGGQLLGLIGIAIVTPVTGTIALYNFFKGRSAKKKTISSYNGEILPSQDETNFALTVGISGNGLSFNYAF